MQQFKGGLPALTFPPLPETENHNVDQIILHTVCGKGVGVLKKLLGIPKRKEEGEKEGEGGRERGGQGEGEGEEMNEPVYTTV